MVGVFMFFLLLSPSSCVGGILSFRCAVVLLLLFFVAVARCLYKCVCFLVSRLFSLLLLISFYLAARGRVRVRYPRFLLLFLSLSLSGSQDGLFFFFKRRSTCCKNCFFDYFPLFSPAAAGFLAVALF